MAPDLQEGLQARLGDLLRLKPLPRDSIDPLPLRQKTPPRGGVLPAAKDLKIGRFLPAQHEQRRGARRCFEVAVVLVPATHPPDSRILPCYLVFIGIPGFRLMKVHGLSPCKKSISSMGVIVMP